MPVSGPSVSVVRLVVVVDCAVPPCSARVAAGVWWPVLQLLRVVCECLGGLRTTVLRGCCAILDGFVAILVTVLVYAYWLGACQ